MLMYFRANSIRLFPESILVESGEWFGVDSITDGQKYDVVRDAFIF